MANESAPKIIVNDTTNLFFKLQSAAFWYFQTVTVSECCLIKLLPYILFEKYVHLYSSIKKWPAQGTSTVPVVSAHFRSLLQKYSTSLRAAESKRTLAAALLSVVSHFEHILTAQTMCVAWWCNGKGVVLATERSRVPSPAVPLSGNNLGQVVHTHVPLSPSSKSGTSQAAVMSCGWEGNRRSGVALTMRQRLQWFIHLRAHDPTLLMGYGTLYLTLLTDRPQTDALRFPHL